MINKIVILAGIILFGYSAKNAASKEETKITTTSLKPCPEKNRVHFKIGGRHINTSGWTISRFSWRSDPGRIWLNVTSNMQEEKEALNVNINGSVPGTYHFSRHGAINKTSHGSYYPDYLGDINHSYTFESGSFIITSIDTIQRTLNATFSGVVRNTNGEKFDITDGSIVNGLLNTGITQY